MLRGQGAGRVGIQGTRAFLGFRALKDIVIVRIESEIKRCYGVWILSRFRLRCHQLRLWPLDVLSRRV
jgi:hypothetical protein